MKIDSEIAKTKLIMCLTQSGKWPKKRKAIKLMHDNTSETVNHETDFSKTAISRFNE
jgi:hypothetical protein